ncbi:hypothetical protein BJV77DRAFT_1150017 [Russula vinacea]|nr:hypothetical protein BJV77DRAFT_1150017 [Russula vinacea]
MSSSYSEPRESTWAVPFSRDEGLCTDGLCIDPALLCAPTGDSILEATTGDNQGRTVLHHSYDAFLSSHFHHPRAEREAFLACFQVAPQPSLPTYGVQPHGAGGRVVGQDIRCGSDKTSRRARMVCTVCNRGFGRAQELARHRKDVHEQSRRCLFCGFKWTRPSNIKAHLLDRHRGKFTAELLVTIQALRGQMIVAFLDEYDQGLWRGGVPAAPGTAHMECVVTPPTPSQNVIMY